MLLFFVTLLEQPPLVWATKCILNIQKIIVYITSNLIHVKWTNFHYFNKSIINIVFGVQNPDASFTSS